MIKQEQFTSNILLENLIHEGEELLIHPSLALELVHLTNEEILSKKSYTEEEQAFIQNHLLKYKKDGLSGIIFDLEATCEDRAIDSDYDNETIEIGAVKVINGIIVGKFSWFVKPITTSVTEFCTKLTTITNEDLERASTFPKALNNFKAFAGDLEILSWGLYDKNQLKKDINRHKMDESYIDWLNQKHRSLKHEHGKALNLNKGKGVGVQKALSIINEKFDGTAHRGIDDAINIAKIFVKNEEIFLKK